MAVCADRAHRTRPRSTRIRIGSPGYERSADAFADQPHVISAGNRADPVGERPIVGLILVDRPSALAVVALGGENDRVVLVAAAAHALVHRLLQGFQRSVLAQPVIGIRTYSRIGIDVKRPAGVARIGRCDIAHLRRRHDPCGIVKLREDASPIRDIALEGPQIFTARDCRRNAVLGRPGSGEDVSAFPHWPAVYQQSGGRGLYRTALHLHRLLHRTRQAGS